MPRIAVLLAGSLLALTLMLVMLGRSTNPVSQSDDLREEAPVEESQEA